MAPSEDDKLRITIFAHATLMVEGGGARVLVDPVFSPTVAAGSLGFTPSREIDVHAIPRLDALLITHNHIDHIDPPSLVQLPRDLPVIIPKDDWIEEQLRGLGFKTIHRLDPWEDIRFGGLRVHATPGIGEIDEIGVVFSTAGKSFWDMSDAQVDGSIARRLCDEYGGAIDVISAKYQPLNLLIGYQNSLGTTFDQKSAVATWLNTACACDPRLIFPWASGVAFQGDHAWANRIAFPYDADEIVSMLNTLLRGGRGRAATVGPGDVIEVGREGVQHAQRAVSYVRELPGEPVVWEPIDLATLLGVPADERRALRQAVKKLLDDFLPFITKGIEYPVFANFRLLGIRWQLAVHLGDGERAIHHIDFAKSPIEIAEGPALHPNYFVHLSGRALQRIFRGEAGTEQFWMCGDTRVYEKVLLVDPERGFWAPKQQGWALIEKLPEPLVLFMRRTITAPIHRLDTL
jgi:hypothetical protein